MYYPSVNSTNSTKLLYFLKLTDDELFIWAVAQALSGSLESGSLSDFYK